jgi:hypothetical protein
MNHKEQGLLDYIFNFYLGTESLTFESRFWWNDWHLWISHRTHGNGGSIPQSLQTLPRGQNCRQYDVEIFRLARPIIDDDTWKKIMQSRNGATLFPLPYKAGGIKLHSSSIWTTSMLLGASQVYRWVSITKGFNT